jgi:hypothetical protein
MIIFFRLVQVLGEQPFDVGASNKQKMGQVPCFLSLHVYIKILT